MKPTISGKMTTGQYQGDVASTRRMLRRDLVIRDQVPLPDITTAKNMAEQLEILERYMAKAPVIDASLKYSIRNAIATGSYTINPQSIAEKFLKFEQELYS